MLTDLCCVILQFICVSICTLSLSLVVNYHQRPYDSLTLFSSDISLKRDDSCCRGWGPRSWAWRSPERSPLLGSRPGHIIKSSLGIKRKEAEAGKKKDRERRKRERKTGNWSFIWNCSLTDGTGRIIKRKREKGEKERKKKERERRKSGQEKR